MGLFTDDTPVDQVLCTAIHEAGHIVAFQAAGAKVTKAKVWKHGPRASDYTRVSDDPPEDLTKYLIAILAGTEAQARWLARYHGHTVASARREIGSDSDSDRSWWRYYAKGSGLTESAIRRKAGSFVSSKFGRIERLGTKLARRGSLSSWSF